MKACTSLFSINYQDQGKQAALKPSLKIPTMKIITSLSSRSWNIWVLNAKSPLLSLKENPMTSATTTAWKRLKNSVKLLGTKSTPRTPMKGFGLQSSLR